MLLTFSAWSQEWAEIGATWHYNHWPGNYSVFTCAGEQMVGGKLCREINKSENFDLWASSYYVYTYYSNDTVYFWDFDSSVFRILYDFGASPGDSWYYVVNGQSWQHPNDRDSILTYVDSTDIININGFNLNRLYVHYSLVNFESPDFNPVQWDSTGEIIEFIGDDNFMFNTYTLDETVSEWHSPKGLRCFEDSTIGFYDFGIVDSCTWWTDVSFDEQDAIHFKLYPNPANNTVVIQSAQSLSGMLEIRDISGRLIKELDYQEQIDISALSPGTYIVVIRSEGLIGRKTFIKK